MTYKEAKDKMMSLQKTIKLDDGEFLVVAPNQHQDFLNFLNELRSWELKENAALKFTSINDFKVCKIWTDTIEVRHWTLAQ